MILICFMIFWSETKTNSSISISVIITTTTVLQKVATMLQKNAPSILPHIV